MAGPGHKALVRPGNVRVQVGEPVTLGGAAGSDVLGLAAGALAGSPPDDPLAAAVCARAGAEALRADPDARQQEPSAGHHYVVAWVRNASGETDLVACGELGSLVDGLLRDERGEHVRTLARRAKAVSVHQDRLLGVAVQREGAWQLIGYLPVRAWREPDGSPAPTFSYHMVWDAWLRLCHWSWVTAIVVLILTGLVIANPGLVPSGASSAEQAGYFMGYVRFVHLCAAIWLMSVLVVRVWNLSTSRISYDRWSALVPFRNRRELRNTGRTLTTYLFLRPSTAPSYFGHNPLQQLTYSGMYLVFLLQVLTGLALWGLFDAQDWFWGSFQWLNHLMGTQQVRLLHYAVMWIIILFIPLHVYLSIRADGVDRTGAISSMVSGGRWIRDGARFEDWPPRSHTLDEDEATREQLGELTAMHDDLAPGQQG